MRPSALLAISNADPVKKLISRAISIARENGGQLIFVDPYSPFSGHFQDILGGTSVTSLSNSVGLILDKQYSGGVSELVSNTGPYTDTSQFTSLGTGALLTASGGSITITNGPSGSAEASAVTSGASIKADTLYYVEINVTSIVGTTNGFVVIGGSANMPLVGTTGLKKSSQFIRSTTAGNLRVAVGTVAAGESVSFDRLRVYEVLGYPVVQATSGARPTLVQRPSGKYAYRFDGTDDQMASNHSVASNNETVVVAYQRNSTGTGDEPASHGPSDFTSGWKLNIQANNNQRLQVLAGNVVGGTEPGTPQIWSSLITNGGQIQRINGVQTGVGALAFTGYGGPINLGVSTGGSSFIGMDLGLFFHCPSILPDAQLRVIERLGAWLIGTSSAG